MSIPTRGRRAGALAAIAAAALGLAACSSPPASPSTNSSATSTPASGSSSSSSGSQGSAQAPPTTVPGGGALVAIGPIAPADRSPAGTAGTAPTVTVPTGAPPTRLESADLIVGNGQKAVTGDTVTVQYVLATYSSGKVIQSSWTSQPFSFTLGAGQVIPGWDKGVPGMQVGGRRELIIPPSLGYGAQSPGPGIAPNDTLVFVIDLLSIR